MGKIVAIQGPTSEKRLIVVPGSAQDSPFSHITTHTKKEAYLRLLYPVSVDLI